jgi:hypothetical protein
MLNYPPAITEYLSPRFAHEAARLIPAVENKFIFSLWLERHGPQLQAELGHLAPDRIRRALLIHMRNFIVCFAQTLLDLTTEFNTPSEQILTDPDLRELL